MLLCGYALAPDLAVAVPVFVAVGAAYICVLSGLNTVVQLRAPAAARGRILSIYMMALGLVYPIGAVIQGLLADAHGIRAVTVAAALALLALFAVVAVARPSVFTNLADPAPAWDAVGIVEPADAGTPEVPGGPAPATGTA